MSTNDPQGLRVVATNERPEFLKSPKERFGPHPVSLANDILSIYGNPLQSKGGRTKAAKNAAMLSERNREIRVKFAECMQLAGTLRHKIVGKLAIKHHLSADRINRILRNG